MAEITDLLAFQAMKVITKLGNVIEEILMFLVISEFTGQSQALIRKNVGMVTKAKQEFLKRLTFHPFYFIRQENFCAKSNKYICVMATISCVNFNKANLKKNKLIDLGLC